MGYSVSVVRRETEAAWKASRSPDFFEDPDHLIPFTAATLQRLASALTLRGFVEGRKRKQGRVFTCDAWKAEALLTDRALYLTASGDGVFEILMAASELSSKTLARYDPQTGEWE